MHQTSAIATYEDSTKELAKEDYTEILSQAKKYNEQLAADAKGKYENGEPVDPEYASLLNVNDSNIMGYISIEKINVKLPIYHGTAESALAVGTGHLEGSSLPIGGESTHTVITGHRGLSTATLFTNLNEVEVDDIFTLNVLSKKLTYQVDQIVIVPPEEVDELAITPGRDYCTMVTCTPFGINTDRILVRGSRIDNFEEVAVHVEAEAQIIDPMVVSIFIMVVLIIFFMLLVFCNPSPSKTK